MAEGSTANVERGKHAPGAYPGAALRALRIVASPWLGGRASNTDTWLTHEPMLRLGTAVTEFSFYRPIPADTHILHLHWPKRILRGRLSRLHPLMSAVLARRMLAAADRVRRRGGFVVWTAHNIVPHEPVGQVRDAIWADYLPAFRERVDLVISLSGAAQSELVASYPDLAGRRITVIAPPHYRAARPAPLRPAQAGEACGVPPKKFIALAARTMRPSKSIVELAACFREVARPDELLIIADACDDGETAARMNAIADASEGAVGWRLGRIEDADLPNLIAAADLSLFNPRTILNSGSLILSLSFDTPVCAQQVGSLSELARARGPRWFLPMPRPLEPGALRAVIDRAPAAGEPRPVAPLDAFAPAEIAARLYHQYLALMQFQGGRR